MTLIRLFFASFLIITIYSCSSEKKSQTFYLVRHAEKDTTDKSENPQLIPEGYERAENLKDILDTVDFKAVLSTKYDRNINTVKPILDAKIYEVEIYEWYEWHEDIDKLMQKNGNFLICGHGDNLLPMIERLGGDKPMEELGHNEYENLFKVHRKGDEVEVEVIKF